MVPEVFVVSSSTSHDGACSFWQVFVGHLCTVLPAGLAPCWPGGVCVLFVGDWLWGRGIHLLAASPLFVGSKCNAVQAALACKS